MMNGMYTKVNVITFFKSYRRYVRL